MFRRNRPKFGVGDLVIRDNPDHPHHQFMIVRSVRWIRPNGAMFAQWVYDGTLIYPHGDEIYVATGIFTVSEDNLTKVTWRHDNQHLVDPRHKEPEKLEKA